MSSRHLGSLVELHCEGWVARFVYRRAQKDHYRPFIYFDHKCSLGLTIHHYFFLSNFLSILSSLMPADLTVFTAEPASPMNRCIPKLSNLISDYVITMRFTHTPSAHRAGRLEALQTGGFNSLLGCWIEQVRPYT